MPVLFFLLSFSEISDVIVLYLYVIKNKSGHDAIENRLIVIFLLKSGDAVPMEFLAGPARRLSVIKLCFNPKL